MRLLLLSLLIVSGLQGAFAKYNFSPEQHVGITENPYVIGVLRGGQFQVK